MTIPTNRFWAKFDSQTGTWHPLIAHSADVAAVVLRLLDDDSVIVTRLAGAAGLARITPDVKAALIYLATLHDIGKANHGFQEKILDPERRRRWPEAGHVTTFLKSVHTTPVLQQLVREILQPFAGNPEDNYKLLAAALCHHGRPHNLEERALLRELWNPATRPGWDPAAEIRRIVRHARRWSGLDTIALPVEVPTNPAFTHLFAGLLTAADWIGSTESVFEFEPTADDDPDAYWQRACERAERACRAIGIVPQTRAVVGTGTDILRGIFPHVFSTNDPTPLQRYIAEMALPPEGARVLIESDTGSGKTEAALTLYARMRAAGRVAGLVFALPTRATASAMYDRVLAALPRIYRDGPAPTIALAMGGDHVRATTNEGLLAEEPRVYEDPTDRDLLSWASSSAKKFFAAEIVVATIDQVLLSGLLTKHAHMRLALLARHLLVVDELHSCDRYMSEVLGNIVDLHTAAGGVAVFMSATLSTVERLRFAGSADGVPSCDDAKTLPYPVVSIWDSAHRAWRDVALPPGNRPPREISWSAVMEVDALRAAIEAARVGARVCVLRNTVAGARNAIARIKEMGAEHLLWRPQGSPFRPPYHSRYTQPDREALDRWVLADFGPGSPPRGVILVATQVVEQSLDVDFDFMVTDLCPIDVLLQRLGRLHRHRRQRPAGFEFPRVAVIAPERPLIEYVKGDSMHGPNGWGPVYTDPGDLELTLRLIRDPALTTISIPRQNRELIEMVYHPEPREKLASESEAWGQAFIVNEGKNLGRTVHARDASIDFSLGYADNGPRFDPKLESRIRTRLGDESVRIEVGFEIPCFYSSGDSREPVTAVDLPWKLLVKSDEGIAEPQVSDVDVSPDGIRFLVNGHTVRYGPDGWHW